MSKSENLDRKKPTNKERREARRRERFKQLSRRQFLKGSAASVAVGLLASFLGFKIFDSFRKSGLQNQWENEAKSLLTQEYSLSEADLQIFLQEGWFDSLPIEVAGEYNSLSSQEKSNILANTASGMFVEITSSMLTSSYAPFREAAQIFVENNKSAGEIVLRSGEIALKIDSFGVDSLGYGSYMMSGVSKTGDELWYFDLGLNEDLVERMVMGTAPSRLVNRLSFAVSMTHEILGHYLLAEHNINFLTSNGVSLGDALGLVNRDALMQESFALHNTALVALPLITQIPEASNSLPSNIVDVAKSWEEFEKPFWYDRTWVEYVKSTYFN